MKKIFKGSDYSVNRIVEKSDRKDCSREICPTCRACTGKKLCSNRANLYTMSKCSKCKDCIDNSKCDKFYIYERYIAEILGLGNEKVADVAQDGKIDLCDAYAITAYLSGWNMDLPHKDTFSISYSEMNDDEHRVNIACKCKMLSITTKAEHNFSNGKCVCRAKEILYGDIDGSGAVDIKDLLVFMQYDSGWDLEIDKKAADIVPDGKVDYCDLQLFMKYLNDTSIKLPHKDNCTLSYEILSDTEHNIKVSCSCGLLNKEETQTHTFVEGACVCGAKEK